MPNPFAKWCQCCERNNSSDWIPERDRYECDACQRDQRFEAEMAATYTQMQEAAE